MVDIPVDREIKHSIRRAVEHFNRNGVQTEEVNDINIRK